MIEKGERYMLARDAALPESERPQVEILATDMGGPTPVLFRTKRPGSDEWTIGRRTADGGFPTHGWLGGNLISNAAEKWGFLFFLRSRGGPVVFPFSFSSQADAERAAIRHGYELGRYLVFRYPDEA